MLPLRLRRVAGHEGRLNDALFQPAAVRPVSTAPRDQQTLVFFGGDVQDYPEVMQVHRDNHNYQHWNLERTARMLGRSFPDQHIIVVRPARIEYKSFSCYDNFVPSNNAGVPDHTPTHSALHHLERQVTNMLVQYAQRNFAAMKLGFANSCAWYDLELLQGVSARLKQMPTAELLEAVTSVALPEEIDIEELHNASIHNPEPEQTSNGTKGQGSSAGPANAEAHKPDSPDPLWWRERLSLEQSRLTLVGFSKGCVVLNQFIYEFHYTKTLTPGDQYTMRFIERVASMYWLDGGHAGGKNTWLTARSLLETLARLGVNVYIHVSPYQVKDDARPWIGREEKAFTGLLKKLGAKVSRYLHESGAPYSLHTHFDVLANFKRVQDSAPASASAVESSNEDT